MTDPTKDLKFRDIDHRDRRHGLTKIGYHYVIERDGTVKHGRSLAEASIHEQRIESAKNAVSICLIGGVDESGNPTNNFTDSQYDAVVHLAVDLKVHCDLVRVKAVTLALTDFEVSKWVGLPY